MAKMAKIVLAIMAVMMIAEAIVMCGCESSRKDANGRLVSQVDPDDSSLHVINDKGEFYKFKYMVVDGHEYLVCRRGDGVAISHSPKCECIAKADQALGTSRSEETSLQELPL